MVVPFGQLHGAGFGNSHTMIVLSQLLLTIRRPSGLKETWGTSLLCPLSVSNCYPDEASHSLIVLSLPPLTIWLPSGLMAMLLTEGL